ncbi:MAG: PD-(D/E)XK nuclease family protein, partial [Cyanobacteria bacterium REEB65]|nr:PD-(D/E)XK nuclease family protein [Cyanobacteria bacterium REEB65]
RLEQMVAGLGEMALGSRAFAAIFEAGLTSLHLGLVPLRCDSVLFGTIERSRHPEIRAMLIVGAQLGTFPRSPAPDPFLGDGDRSALAEIGCEIGPSSRTLIFHERYLLYIAATRASDFLYVSYPLTDANGRGVLPSWLFTQLTQVLPDVPVYDLTVDPPGLDAIVTPGQLASALAANLRSGRREPWQGIADWALGWSHLERSVRPALAALGPFDGERPLDPDLARVLLARGDGEPPDRFTTSVTRLESFAACPFLHFARYALRLQPRRRFQIADSEIGILAHAALKDLVERLRQAQRDGSYVSPEDEAALVVAIAADQARQVKGAILLETGRSRHLLEKITRTLQEAAFALRQHDRRGQFRAIGLEVSFGPSGQLPAWIRPMRDGNHCALEGQIDRIDAAEIGGDYHVRVFDYKLTGRRLVPGEIALGLTLQLPVYLAVARRHAGLLLGLEAGDLQPAAMLYFPIQGKWLSRPLDPEQAWHERLKSHKARGLLRADERVVRHMDSEASGHSELLEVYWSKDGSLSEGRSAIAGREQFDAMERWVMAAADQYMERIRAGEVTAQPYWIRPGRTPCTTCDFRSVCRFDPTRGDRPRMLEVPSDSIAWSQMSCSPAAPTRSNETPPLERSDEAALPAAGGSLRGARPPASHGPEGEFLVSCPPAAPTRSNETPPQERSDEDGGGSEL